MMVSAWWIPVSITVPLLLFANHLWNDNYKNESLTILFSWIPVVWLMFFALMYSLS